MTTASFTKQDLNRIPQVLQDISEESIINITIIPSIESSEDYQQAETLANNYKHSAGRYQTVTESMNNPSFDIDQFITIK